MADQSTISKGEVYISKAMELTREKSLPVPYRLHWPNAIVLRLLDIPKKAVAEMKIAISCLE